MVEPGVGRRALYRSERVGRSNEGGVEALVRESWKSRDGLTEFDGDCSWVGAVGVTTSSRHEGCWDWGDGFEREIGPVGVSSVLCGDAIPGLGGTDWNAWIGRASKNSWAKMNGVLVGSIWELGVEDA